MNKTRSIVVLALACASFFGLGMITAAIGPALPDLAGNTASALSAVGGLFSGLFFGALAAQGLTGLLLDRLGPRWLILGGLLVMGSGMFGVSLARSLPLALACATFAGFGHGIIDVVMNVSVSNLFPGRRASVLNLLNVFFGAGAFLAPAAAGLSLRLTGSSLPALWLGAGLELLLVPPCLWFFHIPAARQTAPRAAEAGSLARSPALWLLGLLLLVYVGVENGAGGWVSAYLQQTTPLAAANAALVASGFWLALTLGRAVAALLGARWSSGALLGASLTAALAGGAAIVAGTGHTALSILGFLLLGFGFGPVFPTTLAITTATFSASPGTAASLAVAMGSIGGMLIPWLQGIVLEASGPRAGALLLPLGAALMLGCLAAIRRVRQNEKTSPQPPATGGQDGASAGSPWA